MTLVNCKDLTVIIPGTMLGGYEAQTEYYPQWHQPYNYVTQLPYGKHIYNLNIHKIDFLKIIQIYMCMKIFFPTIFSEISLVRENTDYIKLCNVVFKLYSEYRPSC